MMRREKYPLDFVDVRIRIILLVVVSITALSLKTEMAMLICLAFMWVWLSLFGCIQKAISYTAVYAVLWGILYVLKDAHFLGNLPLLTVYVRRLLLPVMAAGPVMAAPTGRLIASLNRMKLPKAATLSLAVLFRFMPTLSQEYRSIRDAQKFRGIGSSFWETIKHPFLTIEYILIPMMIRTSKVADELSASAQVRGMKLEGECNSFYEVKLKPMDWCVLLVGMLLILLLPIFDYFVKEGLI